MAMTEVSLNGFVAGRPDKMNRPHLREYLCLDLYAFTIIFRGSEPLRLSSLMICDPVVRERKHIY